MKIGINIHIPGMVWTIPGGGGETFRILQEDGVSLILQEDGTSAILTEAA